MIPLTDLLLIPVSIAGLLGVMAGVKFIAPRLGLSAEMQRKIVHIATGLFAVALPFIFATRHGVILLLAISLAVLFVLRLPAFARTGIGSAVHSVERKSYGEIYLTLAVGILAWFSASNPVLYVLPLLVLTLSDTAAALAGTAYGQRHFAVQSGTKSWEGVVMFFLVTWIIAMITLLLMTDIPRPNVVLLSLLVAAFGALVEAESWGGLDNLFVPVGLHFMLATHLTTPPVALGLIALAFIAALIAAAPVGAAIGLGPHSARAYLVLIFLILTTTSVQNAILPVLAVLAHIAARSRHPCRSRYPDLDLLAVIAGAAMFWLFAGEFFDRNALNVYNLTFAGMALGFLALAVQDLVPAVRYGVIAAGGAALLLGLMGIVAANGPASAWHGSFWPLAVAGLALPASVALIVPRWFARYRSVRILTVALPVPLLVFLIKGLVR